MKGARSLTVDTLPTLLTDCVLVGHAKKADVVFTPRQWFSMCSHMMNNNLPNMFLMAYEQNGKAKFAKAHRAKAADRIGWAWDTITGKAKHSTAIGFYPTNAQRQSRWGAIDFDAHDAEYGCARDRALKAFTVLYQQPTFFVALTTSAGDPGNSGWHLFLFTLDFYPCDQWTRLLRQVAAQIDVPVKSGVCEIFPDECKGIGRGIRAPGTWNPKNGECGLILHETISKIIPSIQLPSVTPKEVVTSLGTSCNERGENAITPNTALFHGQRGEWIMDFAITAPRTRHEQLLKLVGNAFLQVGRETAIENAKLQYKGAAPCPVSTLQEHLTDVDQMWEGMLRKWKEKLLPVERGKFDILSSDNDRDAFRIVRNWSQTDSPDFKIHCESLSQRLNVTLKTAANIRNRLCSLGILHKTADYVPHKLAARYRWLLS